MFIIIFTKKNCITKDEFILLYKRRIYLHSPIQIGIDINSDEIRELSTLLNFNPYNLKPKYTIGCLIKECKGSKLTTIKKMCKEIKFSHGGHLFAVANNTIV